MTYMIEQEFCCYCGINMKNLPEGVTYTKDHLVPKCKGGNDSIENKKPCCSDCNSEKGSRNLKQYLLFLNKEYNKLKQHELNYSQALKSLIYKIEIKIFNAEYWLYYTKTAGIKLYRNQQTYNQWKY